MLPTYCASSDEPKLAGWKNLSSDDRIAVSIHAYVPFGLLMKEIRHNGTTICMKN